MAAGVFWLPQEHRLCLGRGVRTLIRTFRTLSCTEVHGDDFTTTGPKLELDWFESELEGKYELKKGRLGPGASDAK